MLGEEVAQIAQDDPGLVLRCLDAGQLAQPLRVEGPAPNLDLDPDQIPVVGRVQVDVVDREPEFVEPGDSLSDPIALVPRDNELFG